MKIRDMNIWRQEDRKAKETHDFENTGIEELNLSVRSYNCLKRAGCSTVADIMRVMGEDGDGLRKLRNLGSRSESEILESVRELRESRPAQKEEEKPLSPYTVMEQKQRRLVLRPAKNMWNRDIGEFRLSNYAESRLRACGIQTVGDLYATHPKNEPGWYPVRELFRLIGEEIF